MEHTNTTAILINVGVQIINLLIFFWIFKRFFGEKIMDGVRNRNQLLEKIKNAESEYENIIADAKSQSETIITEAVSHKNHVILEAQEYANIEKSKILEEANRKAQDLVKTAEVESQRIKSDLEDNWANGVKQTAKLIVKKLIQTNPDLQDKYIDRLIDEVKKST